MMWALPSLRRIWVYSCEPSRCTFGVALGMALSMHRIPEVIYLVLTFAYRSFCVTVLQALSRTTCPSFIVIISRWIWIRILWEIFVTEVWGSLAVVLTTYLLAPSRIVGAIIRTIQSQSINEVDRVVSYILIRIQSLGGSEREGNKVGNS